MFGGHQKLVLSQAFSILALVHPSGSFDSAVGTKI